MWLRVVAGVAIDKKGMNMTESSVREGTSKVARNFTDNLFVSCSKEM